MTIDINKNYQTKNGEVVVIHTVNGKGGHPVIGEVKLNTGWTLCSWNKYGETILPINDLVEVDERISIHKNYKTKNEHIVEIFTTSAPGEYPVIGIILVADNCVPYKWDIYGYSIPQGTDRYDLVCVD